MSHRSFRRSQAGPPALPPAPLAIAFHPPAPTGAARTRRLVPVRSRAASPSHCTSSSAPPVPLRFRQSDPAARFDRAMQRTPYPRPRYVPVPFPRSAFVRPAVRFLASDVPLLPRHARIRHPRADCATVAPTPYPPSLPWPARVDFGHREATHDTCGCRASTSVPLPPPPHAPHDPDPRGCSAVVRARAFRATTTCAPRAPARADIRATLPSCTTHRGSPPSRHPAVAPPCGPPFASFPATSRVAALPARATVSVPPSRRAPRPAPYTGDPARASAVSAGRSLPPFHHRTSSHPARSAVQHSFPLSARAPTARLKGPARAYTSQLPVRLSHAPTFPLPGVLGVPNPGTFDTRHRTCAAVFPAHCSGCSALRTATAGHSSRSSSSVPSASTGRRRCAVPPPVHTHRLASFRAASLARPAAPGRARAASAGASW
uniref:Putative vegetative cell wall protein gp1 n=2 Tax=Anopheles marajoara TaxID=58244 RepID=A0A2M4BNQ7_9DIPT